MQDLFDLSGKVAIVTGTSRGLGQYFARALAKAGADLVITSRDLSRLTEFKKEIESLENELKELEGKEELETEEVKKLQEERTEEEKEIDRLREERKKLYDEKLVIQSKISKIKIEKAYRITLSRQLEKPSWPLKKQIQWGRYPPPKPLTNYPLLKYSISWQPQLLMALPPMR